MLAPVHYALPLFRPGGGQTTTLSSITLLLMSTTTAFIWTMRPLYHTYFLKRTSGDVSS